jgi:hypothetical protein
VKIYNRYIIITALLLLLTTVILVALGQTSLNVYYITYLAEALAITELFAHLNKRARQGLNLVSAVLFGGFLFIVSIEAIKILA